MRHYVQMAMEYVEGLYELPGCCVDCPFDYYSIKTQRFECIISGKQFDFRRDSCRLTKLDFSKFVLEWV